MGLVQTLADGIAHALGIGQPPLSLGVWQVVLRGVVVYLAGLTMVRLAPKRFMGRHTPFDLILAIILGAILSRAVNGNGPLVPTLAAGFGLILMDRLFGVAAYRWKWFRSLVEGSSVVLVREGELLEDSLRRTRMSPENLRAALRRRGQVKGAESVAEARIERGGEVSVIPRES